MIQRIKKQKQMLKDHTSIGLGNGDFTFVVFKKNDTFGASSILEWSDVTENVKAFFSW